MTKSDETRALVRETALQLFREHGYEHTTMRLIAADAGVSLGNAYYYFPSKGHLVQELYRSVVREQAARAQGALAAASPLAGRIAAVLHAGLDASSPYHSFAGEFIAVAIRPSAAASPFSDASRTAREESIALYADVVSGASPRVPAFLHRDLPILLWLAHLGVEIFWTYDSSPGQQRTRTLVDGLAPLVARLVTAARLPLVRGVVEDGLRLVQAVRP